MNIKKYITSQRLKATEDIPTDMQHSRSTFNLSKDMPAIKFYWTSYLEMMDIKTGHFIKGDVSKSGERNFYLSHLCG